MALPILAIVAVLVLGRLVAGADPGADPLGGGACPQYRCTKSTPVQKARAKFVSHGCNKMGGGMMLMKGGGNEPFMQCCDIWHACYQTCGAPKKWCDDGFKECSAKKCGGNDSCKQEADLKTMMLNMGGCNMYNQAQHGACECVKKDKAKEKRTAALRYFYKNFAPESIDKVDALAEKIDSNAKFAALFRKLHARYPKSIKFQVNDEMARMEEMIKKASSEKKEAANVEKGEEGEEAEDGDVLEMDEL